MPDDSFLNWLLQQAAAAANAPPVPPDTYDYGMPLDELRRQIAAEAARLAQQAELDAFNAAAVTDGGAPTAVMEAAGSGSTPGIPFLGPVVGAISWMALNPAPAGAGEDYQIWLAQQQYAASQAYRNNSVGQPPDYYNYNQASYSGVGGNFETGQTTTNGVPDSASYSTPYGEVQNGQVIALYPNGSGPPQVVYPSQEMQVVYPEA